MGLSNVRAGKNLPEEVNVVIEIPAQSGPVKYEVDKETGAIFVDRFLATAMFYPCNYGYVPETLALDDDPLDVLVVTPHPIISGTVIPCRLIGVLEMQDEAGDDAKLLAVPVDKISSQYVDICDVTELPVNLLTSIQHFFEHYKDLEAGKWVKVRGWADASVARRELLDSLRRYQGLKNP
ncbi:MAG: inorganic diphosphatase [Pseudomonadales bacterium]|nr:inorganic diphosphatase [Pseudomonadales bacterium]